jgi:hypothetical protein
MCEWACSPMVGRSSGMLPTRVQILVLAHFFWIYSGIFRRYALSGKRRSRRRRGVSGDFSNLQTCRCLEASVVTSVISRSAGALTFGGAHRSRVCVPIFIGVSVRVRCEACVVLCNFKKIYVGVNIPLCSLS